MLSGVLLSFSTKYKPQTAAPTICGETLQKCYNAADISGTIAVETVAISYKFSNNDMYSVHPWMKAILSDCRVKTESLSGQSVYAAYKTAVM